MNVENGSRKIVIHGLALVMAGLVWGLMIPHVPYPRLAFTAHIQFVTNGMLFIIVGAILLKIPHQVGSKSICVMLLAVWLTWAMALSAVANAWWGTNQTLPIAAHQAGATGGQSWQEMAVKLTHISAASVLLVAWALLLAGFVKKTNSGDKT